MVFFKIVNYADPVNMADKENTNKKRVTVEDILEAVWNAPSDVSSDSDVGDSDIEPEIEFCNDNVPRGRRPSSIDVRMKGKHFSSSRHPVCRRCCVCGYKKGVSGQYKDTKTSNYCVKCDKFLCKSCFETYHTKSNF